MNIQRLPENHNARLRRVRLTSTKLMVVFGTRPEAIKLAPVIRELQRRRWSEVRVCVTGQHCELLHQMMDVFGIQPDHDLGVMQNAQGLSESTAAILNALAPVLRSEQPAMVIVQGDTTSSLAGALAAYHQRIPVCHVEAGLRTGVAYEPFPEELHRQMIARLATWHFAPTQGARDNLLLEGIAPQNVFVTGNTIVDALRYIGTQIDRCNLSLATTSPSVAPGQRLMLVTTHRRENHGDGVDNICRALRALADRNPELVIVCPVHPNPAVDRPLRQALSGHPRIRLVAPIDYLAFVELMRRTDIILTDSGGIQEEAPSFGVPVLVTRAITERPEGVAAGIAQLVGTDPQLIVRCAEEWLHDANRRAQLRTTDNPYGDGRASKRIGDCIERLLKAQALAAQANGVSLPDRNTSALTTAQPERGAA